MEANPEIAEGICGHEVGLESGEMTRRVLHVVGGMGRGGIENWLMQVLRRLDLVEYRCDFLVRTEEPQAHDDEIRVLGGQIVPCLRHRNLWRFRQDFARVMRDFGPYHVVHSHLHYFDGVVLRCAARHGVPLRISHSHANYLSHERTKNRVWRAYFRLMRSWIRDYATLKIGVAPEAAEALFGSTWDQDPNCQIMPCGIDLTAFEQEADRTAIRLALGIPRDSVVFGHVGRFVWEKNHQFLLDVISEIMQAAPRAWLLLVGDGPLSERMQARARALGIAERTTFAGNRDDVPQLMKGAMDVFVFPSKREGLSVSLLEAQAAGLPCIMSDALTAAGVVVPELVYSLPLEASPALWAEAALGAIKKRAISRTEAFLILKNSEFEIDRSVARLLSLYDRGLEQAHRYW